MRGRDRVVFVFSWGLSSFGLLLFMLTLPLCFFFVNQRVITYTRFIPGQTVQTRPNQNYGILSYMQRVRRNKLFGHKKREGGKKMEQRSAPGEKRLHRDSDTRQTEQAKQKIQQENQKHTSKQKD